MALVTQRSCTDADDQAQCLSGYHQIYEQLGRGRFHGSVWQLVMSDGVLLHECTNRQLRQRVKPPMDHIALAVPLAVDTGSKFAGRPFGRETLMVLSGREEHDIAVAGEMDLIGVSVSREMLQALAPAEQEWLDHAERERNLALAPECAAAIRRMLQLTCSDAKAAVSTLADRDHERSLIAATLTRTLSLAMAGCDHPSHIPRRAETRQKVVTRAIAYMRERINDDIGIAEICSAACASRRSLQYCFEEFLHTTPQAYLRALRLNEARRLLKTRDSMPITTIAVDFGFASASHFTRHYKLMFGELPSQTARSRSDSAPADLHALLA